MTPLILMSLFLGGLLFVALRRRERLTLVRREVAAIVAFALLAILQRVLEEQVQFDDYFFAPLYLSIPVWLGAAGGSSEGFVGTLLGMGAVFGVAAMAPVDGAGANAGDSLPIAQYFLATGVLVVIGVLAGVLYRRAWLAGLLPLFWIAFVWSAHRDLLRSYSPWITIAAAVAVATIGLVLRELRLPARLVALATGSPDGGAPVDAR
ncbi:MAG: hypothetical protein HY905_12460 [Deltaproteobacteria bacterium]|nr:hypothetical protein [Deltaproteobacteria bacterium]